MSHQSPKRSWFTSLVVSAGLLLLLSCPALAGAPPVRIAVVPGGGSGIEQDVVDQISQQLGGMEGVALSTVNPDWYVVCNIHENLDQMSGSIRYNGNVLVKTVGGKVISTVAVQKYNQDFSTSPGAQLNKALVVNAARDVINNVASRAVPQIQQQVMMEMEGRSRINDANQMASQGHYDDALTTLEQITPDFIEFASVRNLHARILRQKNGGRATAHHGGGGTKTTVVHGAHSITSSKSNPPAASASLPDSGAKGASLDKHAILNEFTGAPH